MIALGWIIFAAVLVAVFLFCFAVVRYYTDKTETEPLPFWTAVIGLSLPVLCLLLIPIDIYNVSHLDKSNFEATEANASVIRGVYYSLYGAILVFLFGLIPFAYFYYEEEDENVTIGKKILGGCKYTIFLIVIVVVLLIIGLVLFLTDKQQLQVENVDSATHAQKWVDSVVKNPDNNIASSAISFAVASLTCLGYLVWITYTAYGFSAFPIQIIRGRKQVAEEAQAVGSSLRDAREKKRLINSKYGGGGTISRRDQSQRDKLERQERILSRREKRLADMNTGLRKIVTACKPFMFVFGILFVLISLFLVASMAGTNIYKATKVQWCGAKCGFILAYQSLYNPLDTLLSLLSPFFPVDYVIVLGVVMYIFFATLSGIVSLGVRFLWVRLSKVQYRATTPQGLLITSAYLMLAILALNMELTTLAPQYATWGDQTCTVSDGKEVRCSLADCVPADATNPNGCMMTEVGKFVNYIMLRTSFFGVIFFYATWVFFLTFLIGIVVAFFKAKGSNVVDREDDSDSDEDF